MEMPSVTVGGNGVRAVATQVECTELFFSRFRFSYPDGDEQ